MNYQSKVKLREQMAESLKAANSVLVSEYRGLSVEEVTELRVELRKIDAKFRVVRNRVTRKAIESEASEYQEMDVDLQGPVGLIFSSGDAAQVAKSVLEFQKNHPKLLVKSGFMDGKKLSVDELKAIASLPSKEVLLGKIVGSIIAPHRGLVTVLSGVSRNLVQVINAIKDKKQDETS